jgi:uncharacterized protein
VAVLAFTVMQWRGLRLRGGPATLAVAGVTCGALTTSIGMNGPPLVAVYQAMGYGPRELRATLAAVFGAVGSLGVVGFVAAGLVTRSAALVALVGAPALLVGWLIGNRVFSRMSAERFRLVVRGALVASSVLTLASAVA